MTQNITNPDSEIFIKGNHKQQFAYETYTDYSKPVFVLETVVIFSNVNDSVSFDDICDRVTKQLSKIEIIMANFIYKTSYS